MKFAFLCFGIKISLVETLKCYDIVKGEVVIFFIYSSEFYIGFYFGFTFLLLMMMMKRYMKLQSHDLIS